MTSLEDELKDLKEKNKNLVQNVQYWKMTAAQRENEKLNLMKEINDLRLKLSRFRSNGSVQASNLDSALQAASEKALAHLVRASSEIARTMDLAKAYMRDRQELDAASPRWSSIGSTPNSDKKDKVHRVPPMMIGGQSIQPVVALTMLNTSLTRPATRTPTQTRNVTQRAVPMHVLQDVYIPLTRIDAGEQQVQNMETEAEANDEAEDSPGDLGLDDVEEKEVVESQHMPEDEDFESLRMLDAVTEDIEPEEEVTPRRSSTDNPLEGPSWMCDASSENNQEGTSKSRTNLEPDSTTGLEEGSNSTPPITVNNESVPGAVPRASREFSPTVRRRKRAGSPPPSTPSPPAAPRRPSQYSPHPVQARRLSNSGRVLKVLVAKMQLDGEEGESPRKRPAPAPAQFDAPSPNGATVAGVIVSETSDQLDSLAAGELAPPSLADRTVDRREAVRAERASNNRSASRDGSRAVSRTGSHDSRDSDSSDGDAGEGRTRRPRKVVTYKEKPLNRKLRR